MLDLAWAAGFIEGEGNFRFESSPIVNASQVQKEPLEKLQKLFGGSLSLNDKINGFQKQPIWVWRLPSRRSVEVMLTLYTFMSAQRRAKIEEVLAKWKLTDIGVDRSHRICRHGHSIMGDMPGIHYKNYLQCPMCAATKNLSIDDLGL